MKILIFGKSGAGKTTLARALAPLLGATIFDGDKVRATYPNPVGYSQRDRELHAAHISALCDAVTASGNTAIAATICGKRAMRRDFGANFTIYCTSATERQWEHTAEFEPPSIREVNLIASHAHAPEHWAELAAAMIRPTFSYRKPTALFVGRWHPFHPGHRALIERGIMQYGQAAIGCRDTNNDWPFERVKDRIDAAMREYRGRYIAFPLPNVNAICYGRDVGYVFKRYELPPEIEAISGTQMREIANGQPCTVGLTSPTDYWHNRASGERDGKHLHDTGGLQSSLCRIPDDRWPGENRRAPELQVQHPGESDEPEVRAKYDSEDHRPGSGPVDA